MGVIIRTTADGCSESEIQKDLYYLISEWRSIEHAFANGKPEEKLYEDLPLALQIIRDHLDASIEEVIIDDSEMHAKVLKFVKTVANEYSTKVLFFSKSNNIFSFFGIDKQIEEALRKKVQLKSGGSLIVENTEAMTVIDVNSGKFTGKTNLEETILKINLEAAEEVVQQLKLRNIGGLIVIDFIDMKVPVNKQKLFSHFENFLRKHDRSQSVVLHVSDFGLVQMTRKRTGKGLLWELCSTCQNCEGIGFVKSIETQSYEFFRNIKNMLLSDVKAKIVTIEMSPELFSYITTHQFNAILVLEKQTSTQITLLCNKLLAGANFKIKTG